MIRQTPTRGDNQHREAVARALTSLNSGRFAEAIGLCDDLLAADPTSFEALRLGASARLLAGRPSDAVPLFERALAQKPDDAELLSNFGVALQDCGAAQRAVVQLRKAAEHRAECPDTLVNLACALRQCGELEEAAAACERALTLDPRHAGAHYNRGNALCDAGRLAQAIACYERALALAPRRQDILGSLSNALLLSGDFRRGWQANEARFRRSAYRGWPGLPPTMARWDGGRPPEGALLLVTEQGLGDAIQFMRYGRLLRQSGIRPILQCDRRTVRLFSSSDCFAAVVPFGSVPAGMAAQWYPLLSLPLLFGTEQLTIPSGVPYLHADAELIARWSAFLGRDRSLKVGIAWQGNPRTEIHHLRGRSVPLREFAPLARIPGIRLYCLQKGAGLEQLDSVPFKSDIVVPQPEIDAGPDAFMDTAALIAQMDLVITSDTAIAHLAGALGRRVWVALQHVPDWRWLLDRSDSAWYPTMRLFRQPRPGAWSAVFEAMARELRDGTHVRRQ